MLAKRSLGSFVENRRISSLILLSSGMLFLMIWPGITVQSSNGIIALLFPICSGHLLSNGKKSAKSRAHHCAQNFRVLEGHVVRLIVILSDRDPPVALHEEGVACANVGKCVDRPGPRCATSASVRRDQNSHAPQERP